MMQYRDFDIELSRPLSGPASAVVTTGAPDGNAVWREHLTALREALDTRFGEGELRTLCFDLGIDYDDLPGESKADKARELVAYFNRRERVPELTEKVTQLRPTVVWPDMPGLERSRYEVRVDSPAGQARSLAEVPVVAFQERVEGLGSADSASRQQLGADLFQAFFQGDVQLCYAESLGLAAETSGLRIRVKTDLPELIILPWELLYDVRRERFLALSLQTPVLRSWRMPVTVEPLATPPSLRVLMVTASPSDYGPLYQSQEGDLIESGLVLLRQNLPVDVTILTHATLPRLREALGTMGFDVWHFVGHSEGDALILEDEYGRGKRATTDQVALLLQNSAIRLAVLNGCRAAVSPALAGSEGDVGGSATGLMAAGVPAVVAMQQGIYDQADVAFTHALYASLADGYPVEASVTEARRMLVLDYGLQAGRWYAPVLYMRAPHGHLFDLAREKESKIVSGLALGLSFRLDVRHKLEEEPAIQSNVRKGYKGVAGKLRRLLTAREIGLEIKIQRTYGAELELLSPYNTAVMAPPTFTWRLGADVVEAWQEVLEETRAPEPIEATVSLHNGDRLVWRSAVQEALLSSDLEAIDQGDAPQSLACPEDLFAGLEGGETAYWWELSVTYPVLDLEGTTRRKLYQRAYFRKLSDEEADLLRWLEASLPSLALEEGGMDEVDWHILQGTVYESFDLYDEAIVAYQRAEGMVPERSDLLGHLQRVFHKKAFAVLGATDEGLMSQPVARFAVEANAYRDRLEAA